MASRLRPRFFRAVAAVCAVVLHTFVFTPLAQAQAELVMIEEEWCEWCQRWNEEVGVVYAKTGEGRRAPLRRVDIHSDEHKALKLKFRAQFTPTFVLMDEGIEIGRIEGYPGEDFFWGLLGRLLEKLPEPDATTAGEPS